MAKELTSDYLGKILTPALQENELQFYEAMPSEHEHRQAFVKAVKSNKARILYPDNPELISMLSNFAANMHKSSWARVGDTESDICNKLQTQLKAVAIIENDEVNNGRGAGSAFDNGRYILLVFCSNNSELRKKAIVAHELSHAYRMLYGKSLGYEGLGIFGEIPRRNILAETMPSSLITLSDEKEYELFDFCTSRSIKPNFNGATLLKEGINTLIECKMLHGENHLILDNEVTKENLITDYPTPLLVAELLENALGTEKLKSMYDGGIVPFIREYDQLACEGNFHELSEKLTLVIKRPFLEHYDATSDLNVINHILDAFPNAIGNQTRYEVLAKCMAVCRVHAERLRKPFNPESVAREKEIQERLTQERQPSSVHAITQAMKAESNGFQTVNGVPRKIEGQ